MSPPIDRREQEFTHSEIVRANPNDRDPPNPVEGSTLDNMYRSEAKGLSTYFGHRLRGDDEAADYVHETFARLASYLEQHSVLDPRRFLRKIAKNLLFERTRRLRTRTAWLAAPITTELEPSAPPDQSYSIEAADVLKIYRRALGELPEKTREVFLLHRVDELTYKEIGERLGISIPTVQYHVARALAHLDAALGQE